MTSKICIAGGISAAYSFQMSKDPTVDEIKKIHNEQYLKVDDIKEALKKMSEKATINCLILYKNFLKRS